MGRAGDAPRARKIGQIPISWDRDRTPPYAGARAVPLVRRRLVGQRRPADDCRLRRASQFVRPEDVADSIPCGPDVDRSWRPSRLLEAGFTDIALVQVGGDQQEDFLQFAEPDLLPALRATVD